MSVTAGGGRGYQLIHTPSFRSGKFECLLKICTLGAFCISRDCFYMNGLFIIDSKIWLDLWLEIMEFMNLNVSNMNVRILDVRFAKVSIFESLTS